MSSFISNTENIQGQPTIKNTVRKVTFNSHQFKTSPNSRMSSGWHNQQQMLMIDICKNINSHQKQRVRIMAHTEAQQQLSKLKSKLRLNVRKQNIEEIFKQKKKVRRNLLAGVMKVPTETIQINKKYNKTINLKLSLLNEAKDIKSDKAEYLKWYDSQRNSNTNSPIYSRINYLFEKMSNTPSDNTFTQFPNIRRSLDSKVLQETQQVYHKIHRKKTCAINKSISRMNV